VEVVTIQPVYRLSEVGFVPQLRNVWDPPGVTGFDVGLVISPKSLSPSVDHHRREVFDQVLSGTINDKVVVETFGFSTLENRDDRELFPISTERGTVDLFVEDIKEVTEVPWPILRGEGNSVSPPVVIDPNPLFQGQGHTERMVPSIYVDPLTDGVLKGESVGSHGFPIKKRDISSIYRNRTL
jgi:hypothetical protein